LYLTSSTVSVFTSTAACSFTTGLDLSFLLKLIFLKDQDFFFLRFFSADACTSPVVVSSVGVLDDSSATASTSPLASEIGATTSDFSSSGLTGSLTSSVSAVS